MCTFKCKELENGNLLHNKVLDVLKHFLNRFKTLELFLKHVFCHSYLQPMALHSSFRNLSLTVSHMQFNLCHVVFNTLLCNKNVFDHFKSSKNLAFKI